MKITTLRTGALTLDTVKYKFNADGYLTIEIRTDADHGIYGEVNVTLANVKDLNVYDIDGNLVEDFFNNTFLFKKYSDDRLVYTQRIRSGIAQSESLITLTNNGSAIEATVANSSIDLAAGTYNFNLLDTDDSEFSTSLISIKQLNLGSTDVDGIESVFDEAGDGDYLSINGQDLTFQTTARVSLKDDDSGTTNIPLVIYES